MSQDPAQHSEQPVPPVVFLFLAIGLIAASQSGNIIRIGQAHPVAIAAWRLLIAAVLLAPLGWSRWSQLGSLSRNERFLLLLSGAALACHFFAWIAAVQMTTVARAAIVFAINPVLTAVSAYFIFGERAGLRLWIAIGLGLAGVVVIGVEDLDLGTGSWAGDGMALLCSVLFTVYFLLGKRLRPKLDNRVYAPALYAVAAVVSFGVMLLADIPLVAYTSRTWLCFGLMALIPTMLGHTSFNLALNYLPAGKISLATLSEPALAGLVAWFAWGEPVTGAVLAGYGLIAASVVVVVSERSFTTS